MAVRKHKRENLRETFSAPSFRTNLPTSYYNPTVLDEHHDNITLLLTCIKGIFTLIFDAMEDREGALSEVAFLGEGCCDELRERIEAMYKFQSKAEKED